MNPNQDNIIYQSDNLVDQSNHNLIKEKIIDARSGCCMLCIFLLSLLLEGALIGVMAAISEVGMIIFIVLLVLSFFIFIFVATGFCTIEINEARVLTLFGKYYGTVKKNGFLWCVVVWKINDTAKATFEVANTYDYIRVQSEGVVREIGTLFPYDKLSEEDTITLKGDQKEINRILVDLMSKRCLPAGIDIIEAKITELSYANEIAEVMLKTQAADAVIAARDKIVNGAVSMIGHALKSLDTNEVCKMSREKKAKLVCNMLVILCGESQSNTNVGSSKTRLVEGFNKYQ